MKVKILTLLITAFTLNLYADAVTSGSTVSVNSDSSFNALRNPAFMSRQYAENISFMCLYSYLLNSETDTDIKIGANETVTDSSLDEDFNGAVFVSSVNRSGKNSYGLGISKNFDGQIALSSSETTVQLDGFTSKSTEDKKYYGSNFMLSYSYELNNKESFGLQIETAAFNESKKKKDINTTSTPPASDEKNLKIDKTRVTSGCTFGYYLLENDFEFGAMFKTGRYGVEKQKYKLTGNPGESEKEISNYYINDDGPGVLFGFGLKPSGKFLLSFEAGYSIPYTHKEKSCDDKTLTESTSNINLESSYGARAGINYIYSRFINLGFGGSCQRFKADSSDEDGIKQGTTIYSIYQITAGVDIKPSKDYTLLFGINYNRITGDLKNEESLISFHYRLTKEYLELMAGISCNY